MDMSPATERRVFDAMKSVTGRTARWGPEVQRHTYPARNAIVQMQAFGNYAAIEQRIIDHYTRVNEGRTLTHGRRLFVGQVWRSNDPRRLRGVRILDLREHHAIVGNIITGKVTEIPFSRFTIGREGWSLERDSRIDIHVSR